MARPRDNRTASRRWSPARRHQEFVTGQIASLAPLHEEHRVREVFMEQWESEEGRRGIPHPVQRVWGTASV